MLVASSEPGAKSSWVYVLKQRMAVVAFEADAHAHVSLAHSLRDPGRHACGKEATHKTLGRKDIQKVITAGFEDGLNRGPEVTQKHQGAWFQT